MSRFTLTLPSNSSMNYHPNNTASQYTTKLNHVIELDGNWEVGLLEASFPSKTDNVLPDECFFTIYIAGGKYHEVKLPAGYYTKPDQIVVAMYLAQRRTFRLWQNQPLYATFRSVQRDVIRDKNHKLVRR